MRDVVLPLVLLAMVLLNGADHLHQRPNKDSDAVPCAIYTAFFSLDGGFFCARAKPETVRKIDGITGKVGKVVAHFLRVRGVQGKMWGNFPDFPEGPKAARGGAGNV